MFLIVVDMGERDYPQNEPPVGINIRAWMGVKLVRFIFVNFLINLDSCCHLFSVHANLYLRQMQAQLPIPQSRKHLN